MGSSVGTRLGVGEVGDRVGDGVGDIDGAAVVGLCVQPVQA